MLQDHLVQVGLLGAIGRFQSPDRRVYPRDESVILRTERGLEIGTVLCPVERDPSAESDGQLLRKLGREDQLIVDRLNRFRDRAFNACQKKLDEKNVDAILVDVEHLFDGESLYFYFLGEVTEELNSLTAELAETYDQKVKFKKFAETLAKGCGPDCGTGESKCSTGGCGSCSISGSCGSKKQATH